MQVEVEFKTKSVVRLGEICSLRGSHHDTGSSYIAGTTASPDAGQDRELAPDAQKPHPAREDRLPGDLEQKIDDFVAYFNHLRYHESIGNLTPADVYLGRGQTILLERERIKRDTIKTRRLQHRGKAA